MVNKNQVLGVILAGGQSRRMNSEPKWQLMLGNQMIIQHVLRKFTPQVSEFIINGVAPELEQFKCPVIGDSVQGSLGPLAGILTGLEYAENKGFQWLATCPCDSPFFPSDYVTILAQAITEEDANGAVVKSGGRMHGVFGLWSVKLASDLRKALEETDLRAIGQWIDLYANVATVSIETATDAFFNINTPQDLEKARHYHSL